MRGISSMPNKKDNAKTGEFCPCASACIVSGWISDSVLALHIRPEVTALWKANHVYCEQVGIYNISPSLIYSIIFLNCDRSVFLPEAFSIKIIWIPNFDNAISCLSVFWSTVDTLA